MYSKSSVLLPMAVLLILCAAIESAVAQPFTWSKGGSRPQDYDMGGDPTAPHGSAGVAFVKSKVATLNGSGSYMTSIAPGSYSNQAIKLSAYVKTANITTGYVSLWMSIAGPGNEILSFDDMLTRRLVGTTDWTQYEVVLDVPENSTLISFGIYMFANGAAEAHVDGLQIEPAARTWKVISLATTQTIFSLKTLDENTLWGGASAGVYLRTTDGGTTWKTGTVPGATSLTLNSIAVIDQNTAYFTANNFNTLQDARIYKTADGGTTWTQQYRSAGTGAFFNSIAFWDANNGIAMSDPVAGSFLIVTTTDGGSHWAPVPSANLPARRQNEYGWGDGGGTMLFVQGEKEVWLGTGYYGSNGGAALRVLRSADQGQTWSFTDTPLATGEPYCGIRTLAFADSLTGFAGGFQELYDKNATMLVKTTDGGLSWNPVPSLTIEPSTMQYVPNTNNKMIVTSSGQGFAYSNDAGDTWRVLPSTQPTYALSFASPTVGWAANINLGWAANYKPAGKIFKFIGDLRTAVTERPASLVKGFHLAQNYPNPFNPSTMIQYELPHASQVRLAIYNLLGERVRTMVDAKESAGVKQVTWDGRNERGERVSTGVYVYRLEADEFSTAKRLLFMK